MARGLSLMLLIILLGTQGSSCLKLMDLKLMGAQVYQQQTVTQGAFHVSVSASGWLRSAVYNLSLPNVTANIQEIYVRLGQKVTKGQILAQLDPLTLQQAYYTAQASVNSAKKNLSGALLFERDAITSTNIRIAQAQNLVQAARAFVFAAFKSSDANLVAAQVIVESDQLILDAVRQHFDATLRRAQAQLRDNLNVCNSTFTSLPDSSSGSATDSNAPGLGIPGNPSQESQPQDDQSPREGAQTVADCIRLAHATFKQMVTEANVALTTAEQQVVKDQQLINIARANGGENNTGALLTYEYALDLLVIEKHNYVVTSAIATVETAQGLLEVALAQLEVARQNMGNATLRAPHDGVVTAINGTVGGLPGYVVNPAVGSSAPEGIFIQLVDLSSVRQLLTKVKDADTPTIRVGQPVQFTPKPYPHRQFSGTVSAISPNGLTGKAGDIEYPVIVDFDPKNIVGAVLLPNTTANATITVLDKPNAIRVPVSAIDNNFTQQHDGDPPLISQRQANDALSQAQNMFTRLVKQDPKLISQKPFPSFVVEPTGSGNTYIVKPVVLGLSDGTYYEVLQGLSVGEPVMVVKAKKK
ncbi:efflux RND transporter periplasmic adaptor subunit [Dictyobacter formicarum]|nr:efflux RND transporter periplasmic adaptor subunit [Dictyobacter formicarum]